MHKLLQPDVEEIDRFVSTTKDIADSHKLLDDNTSMYEKGMKQARFWTMQGQVMICTCSLGKNSQRHAKVDGSKDAIHCSNI